MRKTVLSDLMLEERAKTKKYRERIEKAKAHRIVKFNKVREEGEKKNITSGTRLLIKTTFISGKKGICDSLSSTK